MVYRYCKKDTIALTEDQNQNFPGAVYTPDGNYIVYTKGRRNTKLYLMHKNGGAGTSLISLPATLKTIDPAVSADGRYIYYSARTGAWNYNAMLPQYSIGVYDREKEPRAPLLQDMVLHLHPYFLKTGSGWCMAQDLKIKQDWLNVI